jgi:hypothetical protein
MGLAGENQIDNATNHYGIKPLIDSLPSFAPFYGIPYLAISNNNVNGATFTLIFNFIQ